MQAGLLTTSDLVPGGDGGPVMVLMTPGDTRLGNLDGILRAVLGSGRSAMMAGAWPARAAREQLPLLQGAGAFVVSYGPAMALLPLTRPGKLVVELVPHGLPATGSPFARVAAAAGHRYVAYAAAANETFAPPGCAGAAHCGLRWGAACDAAARCLGVAVDPARLLALLSLPPPPPAPVLAMKRRLLF